MDLELFWKGVLLKYGVGVGGKWVGEWRDDDGMWTRGMIG